MDIIILLELFKWLFVLWEVGNHVHGKKKEKALIGTVQSIDQRLKLLEDERRRKS